MRILVLGSNPSVKAAAGSTAFSVDTRSGRIIRAWLEDTISIGHDYLYKAENVSDTPTPNNRPLKVKEIVENLELLRKKIDTLAPQRIVAIGKTAAKALTLLHLDFLEMPHPSGLNRQLNDPVFLEDKIKQLREYLKPK